jgi:hypothetical protein
VRRSAVFLPTASHRVQREMCDSKLQILMTLSDFLTRYGGNEQARPWWQSRKRSRPRTTSNRCARFSAASVGSVAALSAGFVGLGAANAYASPSNAKTSVTGTFDCGAVGTGTFLVNSGNAQAATTWNVAHLTFADGSTAVFQPRALDLTFTFQGQSMTEIASKLGPGSTVCDISAAQDGFSLTGTVTGKVTYN